MAKKKPGRVQYKLRKAFWDGRRLHPKGTVLYFDVDGAPKTAVLLSTKELAKAKDHMAREAEAKAAAEAEATNAVEKLEDARVVNAALQEPHHTDPREGPFRRTAG